MSGSFRQFDFSGRPRSLMAVYGPGTEHETMWVDVCLQVILFSGNLARAEKR